MENTVIDRYLEAFAAEERARYRHEAATAVREEAETKATAVLAPAVEQLVELDAAGRDAMLKLMPAPVQVALRRLLAAQEAATGEAEEVTGHLRFYRGQMYVALARKYGMGVIQSFRDQSRHGVWLTDAERELCAAWCQMSKDRPDLKQSS